MSHVRRSWSRSSRARALILVACTAGLGACGGSDTSNGSTSPAGPTGSSSSLSNTQDTAQVKLTQCLREEGVDVPDAAGHGAFAGLSPAERRRMEAALEGPCREFQSSAFGDSADPQSQGFLDALTKFAVCMRANGVDVPDPVADDPQGPFAVLHSLDQSDPKVAAASSACQDKLPQGAPGGQ